MAVAVSIPEQAEVAIRFEVSGKINITPFVAKQVVDDFLLNSVGNLLYGGNPEFFMAEEGLFWRVPVHYALPGRGELGPVGALLVDVQTGEIVRTIREMEAIKRNAEVLYQVETSEAT